MSGSNKVTSQLKRGFKKIQMVIFPDRGGGVHQIWNFGKKCKSRLLGRGGLLCKSGKIQSTLFKKNRGGVRQSGKFPDYTGFFLLKASLTVLLVVLYYVLCTMKCLIKWYSDWLDKWTTIAGENVEPIPSPLGTAHY